MISPFDIRALRAPPLRTLTVSAVSVNFNGPPALILTYRTTNCIHSWRVQRAFSSRIRYLYVPKYRDYYIRPIVLQLSKDQNSHYKKAQFLPEAEALPQASNGCFSSGNYLSLGAIVHLDSCTGYILQHRKEVHAQHSPHAAEDDTHAQILSHTAGDTVNHAQHSSTDETEALSTVPMMRSKVSNFIGQSPTKDDNSPTSLGQTWYEVRDES